MRAIHLPIALAFAFLISCGDEAAVETTVPVSTDSSTTPAPSGAPVNPYEQEPKAALNLYIHQDGRIDINGREADMATVDTFFVLLAQEKGLVRYSRDNITEEPHPVSYEVLDLLASYGLALRFYSDSTFNTVYEVGG